MTTQEVETLFDAGLFLSEKVKDIEIDGWTYEVDLDGSGRPYYHREWQDNRNYKEFDNIFDFMYDIREKAKDAIKKATEILDYADEHFGNIHDALTQLDGLKVDAFGKEITLDTKEKAQ